MHLFFKQVTNWLLLLYYKQESFGYSVMSNSAIPWTVASQAPLSMEFSRQEYWWGLPFPSPWLNKRMIINFFKQENNWLFHFFL